MTLSLSLTHLIFKLIAVCIDKKMTAKLNIQKMTGMNEGVMFKEGVMLGDYIYNTQYDTVFVINCFCVLSWNFRNII